MAAETNAVEKSGFAAIDAIIHRHNVERGAVIAVLHEIQNTYGHIPPAAIQRVADTMSLPVSEVFGVVTFYAQFRLHPRGKNLIKVCHGTACHLNGAERISQALIQLTGAKEGETSQDGRFTIERVACFGCCSLAPTIMLNGEIYGRLTPEVIRKVVGHFEQVEKPVLAEVKEGNDAFGKR